MSIDDDECTRVGVCSQTCTNTKMSYKCGCVDGYDLNPDEQTCSATGNIFILKSLINIFFNIFNV